MAERDEKIRTKDNGGEGTSQGSWHNLFLSFLAMNFPRPTIIPSNASPVGGLSRFRNFENLRHDASGLFRKLPPDQIKDRRIHAHILTKQDHIMALTLLLIYCHLIHVAIVTSD